jgi:single-stranded-DNA-specific exonuclease
MLQPKSRWKLEEVSENEAKSLADELNLSVIVAKLLVTRGINTVEEARGFLHKEEVDFHDPFLMDGMERAVERIKLAVNKGEKILIYGDYDADGVSSTSVIVYTFRQISAHFDYYIPNRFTEGYGPNEAAFRRAKEQGYDLIVTVDTGISAVHEAEVAKELGLDLIITDHHEPPPILPDAYCIINPKKPGCQYPFKGLAGVGVAFKLAHALCGEAPLNLLDIVCIGTIADLVPLRDENRLLTKKGLLRLQNSEKPGIRALLKVCGLADQDLTAEHVGFAIGPRVNAAGRLDSAQRAVQLFTTESIEQSEQLAREIDQLNKERQSIVNEMTQEAIEEVQRQFPPEDNSVIVIGKEGWNAGVIGIVASRLVERFYRPTIVLSIDSENGVAKGSARSIEGFDMFENLSQCRDILPHFGGHPMAAGMTLNLSNVDELRERLNKQAQETLSAEDFTPITSVDVCCSISDISINVIEQLQQLAPYGVSNPAPKVVLKEITAAEMKRIGSNADHLKLTLKENDATLDVIGFQFGHLVDEITPTAQFSIIGELSINEWNGFRKPQLMMRDIAVDKWQLFDYRGVKNLSSKLSTLPKEKLCLISFRESTIDKLSIQDWKPVCRVVGDDNEWQKLDVLNRYLFILDLPQSKQQMEQLVQWASAPERTYAVFFHEEDHYFNPIPTRDQFKWFYAFLVKRKFFDFKKNGLNLAKYKGWSIDTVRFMSKVFFELEFVKIEDGLISVLEQPNKRDLTDSVTYRRKQEQVLLEKDLCYSSYQELKQCFIRMMNDLDQVEEAIK